MDTTGDSGSYRKVQLIASDGALDEELEHTILTPSELLRSMLPDNRE